MIYRTKLMSGMDRLYILQINRVSKGDNLHEKSVCSNGSGYSSSGPYKYS